MLDVRARLSLEVDRMRLEVQRYIDETVVGEMRERVEAAVRAVDLDALIEQTVRDVVTDAIRNKARLLVESRVLKARDRLDPLVTAAVTKALKDGRA